MNTTPTRFLLGALAALALAAGGCRDMYLSDDIDLDFDWNPIEGRGDTLHTPYVVGTEVLISANDNLDQSNNELDWDLTSSDESVLRIDSVSDGRAHCVAVGPGTSEIRVYDADGEFLYSGEVEVREPTRAELFAHGPLIIGWTADEALVEGPIHILAGGTGTFLVRYYDGDQRLFGNGVLDARPADGSQDIILEERQSFLFENREWLSITPSQPGSYQVDLFVGDSLVGRGEVMAVTPEEIEEIVLLGQNETFAEEDDPLAVLAQAYGFDGEPIYGVEYSWDLDGAPEPGLGDLFRYDYEGDVEAELTAEFQGMTDGIQVHASEGYVDSTNNIGCTVVGGAPTVAVPGVLLIALGFLGLRRRAR